MTDLSLSEMLRMDAVASPSYDSRRRALDAANLIERLERDVDLAVKTTADAIEATMRQAFTTTRTSLDPVLLREAAERAVARSRRDAETVGLDVTPDNPYGGNVETFDEPVPYRHCVATGGTCSQTRCLDDDACWEAGWRQPEHSPVDVLAIMRGVVSEAVDEKITERLRPPLAAVPDTGPRAAWPGRSTAMFDVRVSHTPDGVHATISRYGLLIEDRMIRTIRDCTMLGSTLASPAIAAASRDELAAALSSEEVARDA